jgi:hypothetical protein
MNIKRIHFNQSFRPQYLTRVGESSSEIDIIDEESIETHSSDSEPLIIRYDNSSSSSPCSRRVIIKSTNQTVTISKQRQERRKHRNRKKQWNKFSYENKSLQYSSKSKHHYSSSSEQWKYKDDRLKRLFDEYSSEDIDREWKPLTFIESRELYQYAFDKYHKKYRFN